MPSSVLAHSPSPHPGAHLAPPLPSEYRIPNPAGLSSSISFSPFRKAPNHPGALNGPFSLGPGGLELGVPNCFVFRVEGSHRILLQFGRAVCQPLGAVWKQEVGPVQDTLLIAPVFHPPLKSLFEGWGWERRLMELKKNVEKSKQGERGVSV